MNSLSDWRAKVDKKVALLEAAIVQTRKERRAVSSARKKVQASEEALALAQSVAAEIQAQAHASVSAIVTRCLSAVFDDPYIFCIKFERKRNKTSAELIFERDGAQIDPLQASGGGVVDVAAFALRIACLVLSKPTLRKVLILDEPFRFVSADFRDRVRLLIETLSSEMGIQIIMVTHDPQLRTGTVVDLS